MTIKKVFEKIILIIVIVSILISFTAMPIANAGLKLEDGEFYYSGTTKGTYIVSEGIFAWLLDNLGMIADWIIGLMTMGPRMVFVGWAALIEKLLTWSLEQTAGVNNAGGLVVDSTDLTSIGDSSGNITVQAIVYNQVPLFDINFFKLEMDRTVSGTGHKLYCRTCARTCEECCQIADEEKIGTPEASTTCSSDCKCDGCESCKQYLENLKAENPMVIKIREAVALWYTIIRMLSMIAMLIVLLAIGIKMAISTIASEKAVYKRMFVDWVVGMIILFAIHYMMIFVINMNEVLVNTVKETANSVNKTQMKFVTAGKEGEEEGTQEVSDEEVEISIYEEIRTRAYEPRLSIGLTGMLMYMTLIYFAVRYSLVYLKRYLTIIVLALMGPPLGVAYALQKAISGKSSTLKTWMNEFIMNVIIQIVHALVYAVFISTALVLSLESIPGMVVALIFMNFALKTEKMFREIFKMGESGSLLASTEEAGDANKIQDKIKSAAGLYAAAKPITNAMMNTPMAKVLKAGGKAGVAGVAGIGLLGKKGAEVVGGSKPVKGIKKIGTSIGEGVSDVVGTIGDKASDIAKGVKDSVWGTDGKEEKSQESQTEDQTSSTTDVVSNLEDQKLLKTGGEQLGLKASQAIIKMKETTDEKEITKLQKDIDNYFRYKELMGEGDVHKIPSTLAVGLAHVKKAVNIENVYKANRSGVGTPTAVYRTIFGTKHYDTKSGKMVYDGNGYFSQFKPANLLGLSDDDVKDVKTAASAQLSGLLGAGAMFFGLGTMVAHPKLGGAMFFGGRHAFNKTFRLDPGKKPYRGKYVKARFSTATVQGAQKELIQQAYNELNRNQAIYDSETVRRVRDEHPDLYRDIMSELKTGTTDIKLSGGKGTFKRKIASTLGAVPKAMGLFDVSAYTVSMDKVERESLVRARHEIAQFEKETAGLIKIAHKNDFNNILNSLDEKVSQEAYINEVLNSSGEANQEGLTVEERASAIQNLASLGFSASQDGTLKKANFISDREVTDSSKAKEIEEIVDNVLKDMYKVEAGSKLDLSNGEELTRAIQAVTAKMKSSSTLLSGSNDVYSLFTNGEETLKGILEEKAQIFNNQAELRQSKTESEAKKKLAGILDEQKTGFSEEDQKLIKQLVIEGSGTEGFDATKLKEQFDARKQLIQTTTSPVKPKQESKQKRAMEDFLKKFEDMQVGELSSQQAIKAVMDQTSADKVSKIKTAAKKKSRDKIKKVLAFMEQEGETIAESVAKTEDEVKKAKASVAATDGFTETEAEVLGKLFEKMKEEIVFNEYTKNVLDQDDGQATKAAKRTMYSAHTDYLNAQRDMLLGEKSDTVASSYSEYGVTSSMVDEMIRGKDISSKVEELVSKIDTGEIDSKVVKRHAKKVRVELSETGRVSDLELASQNKIKSDIKDYLNKGLGKELGDVLSKKAAYENSKRKATLSGKVDISSQIKNI